MSVKTDKELRELAIGIRAGAVFTDKAIHEGEMNFLPSIFLPLGLMKDAEMQELKKNNPKMVYEYMSKAGERSVNGYPQFMSFKYLSEDEFRRFAVQWEAVREFMGDDDGGSNQ